MRSRNVGLVRSIWVSLALVLLIVLTSTPSGAVLITIGDPVEGGSWSQQFQEHNIGSFDFVEAFIVSGETDFGDPALRGFSQSGWDWTLVTPDYVYASGSDTTNLTLTIKFSANKNVPFVLHWLAWDTNGEGEKDLKNCAFLSWTGSAWSVQDGMVEEYDEEVYTRSASAPVPEPGTVGFVIFGLVGLAAIGKKRFRR